MLATLRPPRPCGRLPAWEQSARVSLRVPWWGGAASLGPWDRRSLLPAATLSPQGHHLSLPGSTAPSAWSLHPLAGQGSPGVSGSLGCWGGRSPPRGGGGRDQVAGQAGEGTEQETQLHLLTSLPAGSYQRPTQAMGGPCRPPPPPQIPALVARSLQLPASTLEPVGILPLGGGQVWSLGPGREGSRASNHGSKAVGGHSPGARARPRHGHLTCAITASLVSLLNSFLPAPQPHRNPTIFFSISFFSSFFFVFLQN